MTLNHQVDVAMLDFSKAFDKVGHSKLLYKLDYYGVRGNILDWLKLFLHDQTQQFVVNGSKSSICKVANIWCPSRVSTCMVQYFRNLY